MVITESRVHTEIEEVRVDLSWQWKHFKDASVCQAPGRKPKHTCYSVTVVTDGITAWVRGAVCLSVCGSASVRERENTVKIETETKRGKGNSVPRQ